MTGANCASDLIPNNVDGNVSIDVTGTRSIPAGESCVLLESVENTIESKYSPSSKVPVTKGIFLK